ncbi:carbon storage regulator CsrA [Dethiobacter alkaliphilus]|uniref:carbon storage regulator CsrA n=1 Tax=Dethiobacter alkaliphilus TaxID=427926 RepID=UPI0022262A05|nr:carbon storage regulator CsrA [Dethiobacter alkaliphilus]MCW3488760.1 carbon storage regulator CsrA [Dethiobacter alkaliphilus]
MLVLTRKAGENLIIGNNILIKVLEVKGDTVKIGIEAPKEVAIHREEVHEAIKQANRAAALGAKKMPSLPTPDKE